MEEKLEAYRRKKRRQEVINNLKDKLIKMLPFQRQQSASTSDETHLLIPETVNNSNEKQIELSQQIQLTDNIVISSDSGDSSENEKRSDTSKDDDGDDDDDGGGGSSEANQNKTYFTYIMYLMYFLFWITCYLIAIELRFGMVYLLFSALFGIYFNTRTKPKVKGEISAYSVFNKDCHNIDGTLTAAQFEREIRYGPTSVR